MSYVGYGYEILPFPGLSFNVSFAERSPHPVKLLLEPSDNGEEVRHCYYSITDPENKTITTWGNQFRVYDLDPYQKKDVPDSRMLRVRLLHRRDAHRGSRRC